MTEAISHTADVEHKIGTEFDTKLIANVQTGCLTIVADGVSVVLSFKEVVEIMPHLLTYIINASPHFGGQ
jgi:hypothetical protein